MAQALHAGYEVVVGLEVHAQLKTQSKAFAPEDNTFGAEPNTRVSIVSLAHPGAMPKLNEKMVHYALRLGLACGSTMNTKHYFDRKNYFYPDLPKGYQISQDKKPICVGGKLPVRLADGSLQHFQLHHIHMEEDAGKSIHTSEVADTLVDFNRAGVPLLEIVTEPVMRSGEEAYLFMQEIRRLVRYLDICDGNMEAGSLRCDANISVRKPGAPLGTKVEIKNMNSIRNVKRAVEYEAERQVQVLEAGGKIQQETRTFDVNTGKTYGLRVKESLNDYRYFPEPDLSPILISEDQLQAIQQDLPALPWELFTQFTTAYQLSDYDASLLIEDQALAQYFLEVAQHNSNYKAIANWLSVEMKSYLNENNLEVSDFPVLATALAALIQLVDSQKINHSLAAQKLLPLMIQFPEKEVAILAKENDLLQQSDSGTLEAVIQEVLQAFPDKVKAFKKGKKGLQGMFMGEVMKRTKGKADPKLTQKLLKEALDQATY